jgi:two-component system response regulator FixJ
MALLRELGIGQRTVGVHRARVMEKMAARSVSGLVQMVLKTGDER